MNTGKKLHCAKKEKLAVYDIGDGSMEWQVRAEGSLFYTKYGSYETKATGMINVRPDAPAAKPTAVGDLRYGDLWREGGAQNLCLPWTSISHDALLMEHKISQKFNIV